MNKFITRQVIPVKFKIGDMVTFQDQSEPYNMIVAGVSLQNRIPLYDFGGGLRLMESEVNVNCNPMRYGAALDQHLQEFPNE